MDGSGAFASADGAGSCFTAGASVAGGVSCLRAGAGVGGGTSCFAAGAGALGGVRAGDSRLARGSCALFAEPAGSLVLPAVLGVSSGLAGCRGARGAGPGRTSCRLSTGSEFFRTGGSATLRPPASIRGAWESVRAFLSAGPSAPASGIASDNTKTTVGLLMATSRVLSDRTQSDFSRGLRAVYSSIWRAIRCFPKLEAGWREHIGVEPISDPEAAQWF